MNTQDSPNPETADQNPTIASAVEEALSTEDIANWFSLVGWFFLGVVAPIVGAFISLAALERTPCSGLLCGLGEGLDAFGNGYLLGAVLTTVAGALATAVADDPGRRGVAAFVGAVALPLLLFLAALGDAFL